VGVMANCVRDLAILFQAIAGPDERRGLMYGDVPIPDCLAAIAIPPLELGNSVRLTGLFDDLAAPDLRELVDSILLRGKSSRFVRQHAVPPAGFAEVIGAHRVIMAGEAAAFHPARLARHPEDYPPHIRRLVEDGERYPAVAYRQARTFRDTLEWEIKQMLIRGGFFLTPATTDLPPDASTTGDPAFNSP